MRTWDNDSLIYHLKRPTMTTRKIVTAYDAIRFYNHPNEEVRNAAQEFLLDKFRWDLIDHYNEENNEHYDWLNPNWKFEQRAYDQLNYLFQKD